MVTKLRAGWPGFDSRYGRFFLFVTASRQALGFTQPPVQWVPAGKQSEHAAGHSPPSSAEVNAWSYTSIPPQVFMLWCLINYMIRLHGMVLS
jgi:hypothetical protein